MASIRIKDDGSAPVAQQGFEAPFKQGEFYVFEVPDDVARYWNKLSPQRRDELYRQSKKERKDLRAVLDSFVHKPAHVK